MNPSWLLYLGIFVGPFVQEDAAVIAAATLSAHDSQHFPVVFFVILFGLFFSDIWKYWIGYSAHASARARKWADNDKVMALQDKVKNNALLMLLTARLLPMARIPAYVACGYFKMNYVKFCAIIFLSAFIYCAVIFAAIHQLGEAFGDEMGAVMGVVVCMLILVLGTFFGIRALIRRRKKSRADIPSASP